MTDLQSAPVYVLEGITPHEIQPPTVYPAYWVAAKVAATLNEDDATLDTGWSYTIVGYLGGFAIQVIDEDGFIVGKL